MNSFPKVLSLPEASAGNQTACKWLLLVLLITATALAFGGCSQPVTGGIGTIGAETQRGLIGYEKTRYVYPVQVPGTNRYVEMQTKEPLDKDPTYEDYLKWKENN